MDLFQMVYDWFYPSCGQPNYGDYLPIKKACNGGSFSQVIIAEKSGKQYALKIVKGKCTDEINILKKIAECPNVVKYVEDFSVGDKTVIVTEYCEGMELFESIANRGPYLTIFAKDIFKQLCEAMACVHSKGVVHRDLKPENIIIDSEMRVKIVDWGLAFEPRETEERKHCGSPHYAPPEMVTEGLSYWGDEVDVWSLGCILYALVTAKLPFDDEFIPALFKKIRRCNVNYTVPGMTPDVQRFLEKIFVKNNRPTVQQLLEDPFFSEI